MSVDNLVLIPSPPSASGSAQWQEQVARVDFEKMNAIEQGYFVFTMMPSLRCSLNCPHCYLSLEQRRSSEIMSIPMLEIAFEKVSAYFKSTRANKPKVIVFYWYGGEPTEMGLGWFMQAFALIERYFPADEQYHVRHDILTSLITVDEHWLDVFSNYGRGQFQTSFDGVMRGAGYVRRWEAKVRQAVERGLGVSTISVVNQTLLEQGPKAVLDYLLALGIKEASFLPFMLNEQNAEGKYDQFAGTMTNYSQFMIELSEHWLALRKAGKTPPMIGQMMYILSREDMPLEANIAGQTLFLMPNGDFVLPDYRDGWMEFMRPFGNIFKQEFSEILTSPERRAYLRRQYMGNMNPECLDCDLKRQCIMEFWKPNRPGDDCFGAKTYVQWLLDQESIKGELEGSRVMSS